MSETTCRWNGAENPRLVKNAHLPDCEGGDCRACLPCEAAHCPVCRRVHSDGACATCTGEARTDLHAIATMCRALPAEVRTKGVDSEAMALMAPAADPEAWGHITTSMRVGRLPAGYLQCDRCDAAWPCERHADHELHPLFVLAGWEQVWRDALDHDTDAVVTISEAVRYLDQQLTYMAGYEHAPFEDFARDLRHCRAHLESVLHDQNQGDRANVGCFECGGDLERRLGKAGFEDHWTCRKCKQRYTQVEYNFALRAKLEDAAESERLEA